MARIVQSLRQIAPPRLRNLADRLGWQSGQPGGDVEPGEALFLWIAQFLGTTSALTSDQIDLILGTFGKSIKCYGETFAAALDADQAKLPVGHLMIADGRFASISGSAVFLDLNSGDVLQGLKRAPAVVINYNMGEVYIRQATLLNRQDQSSG